MIYGTGFADPGHARRIMRLAESIKPPERLGWRVRSAPAAALTGPVLVRGRGLDRRPRSPLPSLLATLLVPVALLLMLLWLLG